MLLQTLKLLATVETQHIYPEKTRGFETSCKDCTIPVLFTYLGEDIANSQLVLPITGEVFLVSPRQPCVQSHAAIHSLRESPWQWNTHTRSRITRLVNTIHNLPNFLIQPILTPNYIFNL